MTQSLVDLCQSQLIQALQARILATEQAIGQHFAFEIFQRDTTTAVFAHGWPQSNSHLPFHRIFHYAAPVSAASDPLLDRIVDEQIDVVIEVLPGSHQARTRELLHRYHFELVWHIPWFYLPLETVESVVRSTAWIETMARTDLSVFAEVLCEGYGYQGAERDAWQLFAQSGYRAPGFVCFLAMIDQQAAAAGVLHSNGSTALVDGATTLPNYRGRGLQKALLTARLVYAKQQGAAYAFSRTGAGSISQANLEKLGMRLLVESSAWRRR